jgi:glycerol uptake facilitator-like aquaporin
VTPPLARRALAEGLAVFALVFAGCGAIISNELYDGALGDVGIALVFGLVIMTMVFWIYVAGPIVGSCLGALAYQLVRGEPGVTG